MKNLKTLHFLENLKERINDNNINYATYKIGEVVIYNNKKYVVCNIIKNKYVLNDGDEYVYDVSEEDIVNRMIKTRDKL